MDKQIHLTESEWAIMQILWQNPPRTIMQLTADLSQEKGWAKTTVMTLLNRMQAKGAVRWEDGGKARLYYPAVEQAAVAAQDARGFLNRVYQGSVGMMLNNLIQENSLSKAELDELYALLKQAEEKEDV